MAIPPFDPASEPLGSFSPVVRRINSTNFDLAMHVDAKTWLDRFGRLRKTWAAVETEIEGLLIAGGKIFDTEAEGRAAAEDGQYFFAASDDPNVSKSLYKRISASESQWIADDPSAEFVAGVAAASTAALDLASQPGRAGAMFHTHDTDGPGFTKRVFHFLGRQGESLAGFNKNGHFTSKWSAVFHTHDDTGEAGYAEVSEQGRVLSFVNTFGQVRSQWRAAFHTHDAYGSTHYAYLSSNAVLLLGYDAEGRPTTGGGLDPAVIPEESFGLSKPDAFWNRGLLSQAPRMGLLLTTDNYATYTRPFTKQYDFFDELMSRHSGQITKETIGQDTVGNDIDVYTFDFTAGLVGSATGFERSPPIELILTSGLHGSEANAQMLAMVIAEGIADNWRDDPVYSKLRFQCVIRFVPCCNPNGISAGSRYNANGVDLNRNFPADWDSGNTRPGPSPASEIETQVLMELPTLYPNTRITLDLHTHWGSDYYLWAIATNQRDYNLVEHYCRAMTYDQIASVGDNEYAPRAIYPSSGPTGTLVRYMGNVAGKAAFLHETAHGTVAQQEEIPNGSRTNFKRFGLAGILKLLDITVDREINFLTQYPSEVGQ